MELVYILWDFKFKYEIKLVLFDTLYVFDLKINLLFDIFIL